jgi:apolipoprotein N-acyltransferase
MLLAGALHTTAFAPLEWWWAQPLAVLALVWAVQQVPAQPERPALRHAAWCGGLFSLGWLSSGFWWLYISLHDFGGLAAPLSVLAVALLAAFLSLYLAGALALWARWRCGRPGLDALGFALCWLGAELARAQMFGGFPWIAAGYAHTTGPWAAWAPWLGVYGLGVLATWLAAALGLALGAAAQAENQHRSARLFVGAGLAALPLLLGPLLPSNFTQPTGELSLSLLQPNVPQDLKFEPTQIQRNMLALQAQMHAARGALVVSPESVLPLSLDQLPQGFWAQLTAPYRSGTQAALIGIFLGDPQAGYVNSLAGVQAGPALGASAGSAAGIGYQYGKRHLLPFGESIPYGFGWFVRLLNIPLADQAHGQSQAPFVVQGQKVRPLICYEDLFGEDFADSFLGPDAPTVLVNVSNLAWFGKLMIQEQHLQFSRMRAMEFQRPLLRATNTGATAAIDPQGRITAQLPGWTTGTLDVTVQGRSGTTPYAHWLGRLGLWPLWVVVLAGLAWLRAAARRGQRMATAR